jgi:hypothetical protein
MAYRIRCYRYHKKEHLVTGYDENYIYFNDPMTVEVKKTPINDFREAWIQMGKQAITLQKIVHGFRTMAITLFVRIKFLICFYCMFN